MEILYYCIYDQKSFSNLDSILHKLKPRVVWCRNIYTRCNAENKNQKYNENVDL
jgi:hypothetical protein